jgi:hypothetical protein
MTEDFARLSDLLRLIIDSKGCQLRLDQLTAATVKADEARAGAERAQASLAEARDEQAAELAKRHDEVSQYHATVLAMERDANAKLSRINEIFAEMRRLDERLRRSVMNYAGWLHIDSLQALPSWGDLDHGVLGKPRDGDLAEPEFEAPSVDIITEPAPNLVAGSSLSHSRPATAAERRAQRRGAEPRVQSDSA